jgi:uncharacterized SAM-binding protein YcdF (DUF218 family)
LTRRTGWALGGLALLGLAAAAARLALPVVPGWFLYADPPAACDVILAAGSNPAGSTEAEGARLWHAGFGRCILCLGRQAAWHVAEEEVMARHLRSLGIPASRILIFDIPFSDAADAGTMREENRLLLPLLRRRGFRSVLVISSALESRRRSLLLRPWRRAGLRVLVHPIPDHEFRAVGWWRRKMDTKRIVSEALGWLTLPFGG